MTDRELLIRIDDLLNKKARWSGNPNFNDKKAYVTFLIRDYVDIVTDLSNQLKQSVCDRCGKVNPAEIHTCTPLDPLFEALRVSEKREWVGLTGEELQDIYQGEGTVHFKLAMVEAKLKDKNNG